MTYRDQLVALSEKSETAVIRVYRKYVAGEISKEATKSLLAAVIAQANSRAVALADLALAAQLMLALGEPVAVAGTVAPLTDTERLIAAAATVLAVAEESESSEAIVGRLGRNEPLSSAAESFSAGMKKNRRVKGWVRDLEPDACQLCEWWWRDGRVWPAAHPMPRHPGCTCSQKPVVADHIKETGYTRRLHNA